MAATLLTLRFGDLTYANYCYGIDLSNIILPTVTVIEQEPPRASIYNEKMSNDTSADSFCTNTRSGGKIITYYDTCVAEGRVLCLWCPKEFDIKDNCGIIVKMESKKGIMKLFRTKVTCSEECSLAYVEDQEKKGRFMQPEYKDSAKYHRYVHAVANPDKGPLVPAKDPSLHRRYGGSMSDEEWRRSSTSLSPFMMVATLKSTYTTVKR